MRRLTEANIRDLYLEFSIDYQNYSKQHYSKEYIWWQMQYHLEEALTDSRSALSQLDPSEKAKAKQLLAVFWSSQKVASESSPSSTFTVVPPTFSTTPSVSVNHETPQYQKRQRCYCHNDSFLYDYMLLNAMMGPSVSYPVYRPFWNVWSYDYNDRYTHHHSDGHHHGRRRREDKKDTDQGSLMALLAVVAVVGSGLIIIGLAMYYLVQHLANDIERLFYDEGFMRAITHIAITLAAGTAGMALAAVFLSGPFIALGLSAGLSSPLLLAAFGSITVGFMASTLGCYLSTALQESWISGANSDKIDPLEPQRFSVSKNEARLLESKGLDPLVVRAAMVVLRSKIAEIENAINGESQSKSTKAMPFFLERKYGAQYKQDIHKLLEKARLLKRGALTELDIDNSVYFDFRKNTQSQAPTFPFNPVPSAPPATEFPTDPGRRTSTVYNEVPQYVPMYPDLSLPQDSSWGNPPPYSPEAPLYPTLSPSLFG